MVFLGFCAKRLLRSSGPPGASVRPASPSPSPSPVSVSGLSPYAQISKCSKNGPPETDFRGDRTGRGVPILVHFWDLTQIRQLTQSDPIILILCVHKKPKWITQRFAPPALRVLSSIKGKQCYLTSKLLKNPLRG